MSAQGGGHTHGRKAAGGPNDGGDPGWFGLVDIIVWVGVAAVAVIGAEWLFGKVIRESIAAGASKYLKQTAGASAPE